ncbi:M15 family metallopeptidase [Oerskovia sp. NPDC057915]|uniref:M15 family metallopeptidase n=1 Tax=Oerskovia sp. NPDC057915 TaxID=3346280 RepID=UPI0036DDA31C
MDTRTPPPSFAPVPTSAPPLDGPPRPPRVSARRRRAAVLATAVTVLAVVAALAWAFLPDADRGLRTLVADTLGTEEAGDGAKAPDAAPGPAAAPALPAEDDPRQEDDTIDPFDDQHPAIAGLDEDLRAALQAAAQDAQAAGVDFWVTSGWRSTNYQQSLLDRAVDRYGSLAEARKFVSTPETSEHVQGRAVDIGPTDGADWTIRKGARYGLCQTYANEMWHFELATTPGGTCPQPLPDAAG